MTQREKDGDALRRVLEDLVDSRGYTLDGLTEETRRRGHRFTPAEIVNGDAGFGDAVDDVLRLTGGERRRVANAAGAGWGTPRALAGAPRAPGFARYNQDVPEHERVGTPVCSVSHPAAGGPCGKPASVEVWALPFCPEHGREAEAAALSEMHEAGHEFARDAVEAARTTWRRNGALLSLVRASAAEAQRSMEEHDCAHEAALQAVYGDADDSRTDTNTLVFGYEDLSAGTPSEWCRDARVSVCRLMREAHEDGLVLAEHLEPVREWATIQEVLAVRRELAHGAKLRAESGKPA